LLTVSLGFSAGVMIYISFVEIFAEAKETFIHGFGEFNGTLFTITAFFGGILLIGLIDKFIPSFENPHEMRAVEEMTDVKRKKPKTNLYRTGIFTALVVAIHNFPEGIATFMTALNDPTIGIAIAIAVAIHNIPEGMTIGVPLIMAGVSPLYILLLTLLTGLPTAFGAVLGEVLGHISEYFIGFCLSAAASSMLYVTVSKLIPEADILHKGRIKSVFLLIGFICGCYLSFAS